MTEPVEKITLVITNRDNLTYEISTADYVNNDKFAVNTVRCFKIQSEKICLKPYYRRQTGGVLSIFCVEVVREPAHV